MNRKRFILSLDSIGALLAGCLILALIPLIQTLYNWTPEFARFIGFANIGYGLFSGALALVFRKTLRVPLGLVAVLIAGNGIWAVQCFFQSWRIFEEVSYLGLGHLVFEGAYVGALAYIETKVFFLPRGVEPNGI
jgi:hypothetical protein